MVTHYSYGDSDRKRRLKLFKYEGVMSIDDEREE